jgi:enamine deaminase RidA (YjgF/YER057c/UK114 family)
MKTEKRLQELGIELPNVSGPMANYVNAVRTGNLLFLSGKGPGYGAERVKGKVGADMTMEEAKAHARSTGLNLIAVMKDELGDLDRVIRIVKVLGMVNCTPDFGQQPQVINGCSDLFVEVFGDRGRHARSAVGMAGLPVGIPVEIECIVEVSAARAGRPAARKAAKKKVAKKAVKKAAGKKVAGRKR